MPRDVQLQERARHPERERDLLAAAVKEILGTLNYYSGPGARTAVSHESEERYWRLLLALRRATGEPCPRCDDTGTDRHYVGTRKCMLAAVEGHGV